MCTGTWSYIILSHHRGLRVTVINNVHAHTNYVDIKSFEFSTCVAIVVAWYRLIRIQFGSSKKTRDNKNAIAPND